MISKLIIGVLISVLTASLVGCSPAIKAEVTVVDTHPSYKQSFYELVAFVRANRKNTDPSVKTAFERKVFEAGMEYRCFSEKVCRLIYRDMKISFDDEMVQIELANTVVKIQDLNKAAEAIYDSPPKRM